MARLQYAVPLGKPDDGTADNLRGMAALLDLCEAHGLDAELAANEGTLNLSAPGEAGDVARAAAVASGEHVWPDVVAEDLQEHAMLGMLTNHLNGIRVLHEPPPPRRSPASSPKEGPTP